MVYVVRMVWYFAAHGIEHRGVIRLLCGSLSICSQFASSWSASRQSAYNPHRSSYSRAWSPICLVYGSQHHFRQPSPEDSEHLDKAVPYRISNNILPGILSNIYSLFYYLGQRFLANWIFCLSWNPYGQSLNQWNDTSAVRSCASSDTWLVLQGVVFM